MKEQHNLKNKYTKYVVGAIILLAIIVLPFMNIRASAELEEFPNMPAGLSAGLSGLSGLPEESSEILAALPAAISSNIDLADNDVLVFHSEGKYLIVPTIDASNAITAADWLAATTAYDPSTTVTLPANVKAHIRTIGGNVVINSINGDELSTLYLLESSDLTVDNPGGDYGISVGEFEMGSKSRESFVETKLTVSAGVDAFRYMAPIIFYSGSKVNVTGGNRGFAFKGVKDEWNSINLTLFETAVVHATATGPTGIAAELHGLYISGGEFYADAPAGIGGVQTSSGIEIQSTVYEGNNTLYSPKLIATSDSGKAIYATGHMFHFTGAEVSGITENGVAGISIEYSMQAMEYNDGITRVRTSVYGKAKTGFGIIVQNTFDNETFPNGSLNIQNSKIEGYVEEGMGISSYMIMIYESELVDEVSIRGTAELGIGISACSINAQGKTIIEGISLGSTENHYQVYGSIPDSAGISVLSLLNAYDSNIIASAPITDPDSYGIHAELFYEMGGQSGRVSLSNSLTEVTGGIGIFAGESVDIHEKTILNVNSYGDSIRAKGMNFYSGSEANIKSANGMGVYLGKLREGISLDFESAGVFYIDDSKLNIEAKTYGLYMSISVSPQLSYSESYINVVTSDADSTGIFLNPVHFNFTPAQERMKFDMLSNLHIDVTAGKHALHFKNIEVILRGSITATAGETPILFEYEDRLIILAEKDLEVNGGQLIATSRAVAPDAANRKAAVSVPRKSISYFGSWTENYEVAAEKTISTTIPQHIYSQGLNMTSPKNYNWSESSIAITASDEGIISPVTSAEATLVAKRTAENIFEEIYIFAGGTHTINMKARANYYTLSFDTDAGSQEPTAALIAMGSSITEPTGITKNGYKLDYWFDMSDNTRWDFATMPMPERNLTLKASWTLAEFAVSYSPNTDDTSVAGIPATENVLYTSAVTEPAQNPTRDNHLFVAWFTDAAMTTEWNFTSDTMPSNDMTLYAQWKQNVYKLAYDTDGGTPPPAPASVAMGSSITEPTGITKNGYKLDYWFDMSDNTRWDFATMPMPERNLTLKASWTLAEFAVSYSPNTDDTSVAGIPATENVLYTSAVTEPAQNPTRDNHLFVAWFTDAAMTTEWNFTSDTMPSNDMTLYAQWKQNVYAVTYEGRGGDPVEQVKDVKINTVVPEPDITPTRAAYKFTGWYKDPAGTQPWTFGDLMQEATLVLYAGWERTHWIVSFDAATGNPADNPANVLVLVNDSLDLAPYQESGNKEVKRAGNFILGWVDETGAPVKSIIPGANQKLTAKWIPAEQIMSSANDNIVIYKNESTQAAIESKIGAKAQYTDLYGSVKTKDITLLWNPATIGASGVEKISFAVKDSSGAVVSSEKKVVLYVLNKPYLSLGRAKVVLTVGQSLSGDGNEFRPMSIADLPNFEKQTIDHVAVPTIFDKSKVIMSEAGDYQVIFTATYTDIDGKIHTLEKTGTVAVWPKEKPDPEDTFKRENREYWEAVAKVILNAKPGETWIVTIFNYKTGGILEDATIAKNAGYDRMVIAEPGKYMYLTPHPLNRLKAEKTTMFEIRLPGRTWNFHGKDSKTSNGDVREEYPLKMNGTLQDERITKLLPAKTKQMQIEFEMNQAWFAEPILTILVNDALKESSAAGKALYMFHYNENTNELELVGKMTKQANGTFSIRMKEVYKYYVITAEVPNSLNIHITNKTNELDPATAAELAQGIIDSGRNPVNEAIDTVATSGSNKPGGVQNVTTGASHVLDDDQGRLNLIPIGLGSLGVALIGFFFFILFKRKKDEDEDEEEEVI